MKDSKILKYFFNVIFVLSPITLMLVLSYIFKVNALVGRPVWSDEVGYWREIFSFVNFGTKTGYYGIQEAIPKIGQFSTHGFFPFAKILG